MLIRSATIVLQNCCSLHLFHQKLWSPQNRWCNRFTTARTTVYKFTTAKYHIICIIWFYSFLNTCKKTYNIASPESYTRLEFLQTINNLVSFWSHQEQHLQQPQTEIDIMWLVMWPPEYSQPLSLQVFGHVYHTPELVKKKKKNSKNGKPFLHFIHLGFPWSSLHWPCIVHCFSLSDCKIYNSTNLVLNLFLIIKIHEIT
jgi:hypothetical protein